jgi:hypothetical protein
MLAGGVILVEFGKSDRNGFPSQFASRKPMTIPAIKIKNVRLMTAPYVLPCLISTWPACQ